MGVILLNSNEEMEDISKIVKSFEGPDILLKAINGTIGKKATE